MSKNKKNLVLHKIINSPLARKQLLSIIVFSSIITLLGTGLQLFVEYKDDIKYLDIQLSQIESGHLESLIGSLWTVDTRQIKIKLNNILSLRDIVYLEIVEKGKVITSAGKRPFKNAKLKKYPMTYNQQGTKVKIANLHAWVTYKGVYQRMLKRLFIILGTQSLKTFIVSLFILFILYQKVIQHLIRLSDHTRTMSLDSLNLSFSLNRSKTNPPDELDSLVNMFNNMRQKLNVDVNTIKKTATALEENEQRLSIALQASKSGIWDWNIKTGKVFFDKNYFSMAGYEPDEFPHKFEEWEKRVHPNDLEKSKKEISNYLDGTIKEFAVEFRFKTKQHDWIWILSQGKIFEYDKDGSPIRFTGTHRNITKLKLAQFDKIKAHEYAENQSKTALIGQIAGKIAHDFNNILGIIMGNTELSLLDCKNVETRKTLELIFEQTLRGKNLTKNLVAFAKNQEPKQHFFSVNKKVELVLNLLKKDLEGIDAIKEDGIEIPDLLADPGMIEHALVNLVQNSIHATSMVDQPRIIIRTFHKDKNIYIEIEDNGCGIPEEALNRIYDPAFTMKGSNDITNSYKLGIKGTGYGMANVKKYIEQHKGNILIDSKVGEGTKVTISFPVIKKELTEKEIIELKKEILYFEKYILLVEDESAISDVQYKILTHEPCNHKVDIAATGQMAVDLFNRNKYDFASLDYILPGELNGMDVYKYIRQTNDTLPILFFNEKHGSSPLSDLVCEKSGIKSSFYNAIALQPVAGICDEQTNKWDEWCCKNLSISSILI